MTSFEMIGEGWVQRSDFVSGTVIEDGLSLIGKRVINNYKEKY